MGFKVVLGLLFETSENFVPISWVREAKSFEYKDILQFLFLRLNICGVMTTLTLNSYLLYLQDAKTKIQNVFSFLHIFYIFSFQQFETFTETNCNECILRVECLLWSRNIKCLRTMSWCWGIWRCLKMRGSTDALSWIALVTVLLCLDPGDFGQVKGPSWPYSPHLYSRVNNSTYCI